MPRFHHLWIVEAELEVRNPRADGTARADRIFEELLRYASDDTEPYPVKCARNDDGWLEITFPVFAANPFAALASGAALLSEAVARADTAVGVVRLNVGESGHEIEGYRERFHEMESSQ